MNRLSHVIASQGYFEYVGGKYKLQQWVENVNFILLDRGDRVHVFTCGEVRRGFISNCVKVEISKRFPLMVDPFSPDILTKILVSEKPALVIIHGLQHILTLSSAIVYSLRNVPVVIIVHGVYPVNSKLVWFRDCLFKFMLKMLRNSCLLVALTNFDKQILLKDWRVPPNNIRVTQIPLCINPEELQSIRRAETEYLSETSNTNGILTILFIGRLSKQKRVDMLIRSVNRVNAAGKLIHVVIVGDGPEKKMLQELAGRLHLTSQIEFTGTVKRDEIWKYLVSSDVLALPSKHEGFPRVILEAFACGKPVLASNVCGISEVVSDGINGLLFNNEEELTEKIIMILHDKGKLHEMSKNIRNAQKDYLLSYQKDHFADILKFSTRSS
jgi:glycosyltransferase involved in cell wall biosynthesis